MKNNLSNVKAGDWIWTMQERARRMEETLNIISDHSCEGWVVDIDTQDKPISGLSKEQLNKLEYLEARNGFKVGYGG